MVKRSRPADLVQGNPARGPKAHELDVKLLVADLRHQLETQKPNQEGNEDGRDDREGCARLSVRRQLLVRPIEDRDAGKEENGEEPRLPEALLLAEVGPHPAILHHLCRPRQHARMVWKASHESRGRSSVG